LNLFRELLELPLFRSEVALLTFEDVLYVFCLPTNESTQEHHFFFRNNQPRNFSGCADALSYWWLSCAYRQYFA